MRGSDVHLTHGLLWLLLAVHMTNGWLGGFCLAISGVEWLWWFMKRREEATP